MKRRFVGPFPYLRGAGIAVFALILRLALNPILGMKFPFLVSYPAVLLSAWLGGPISAAVTTFLLTVATAYLWLAPLYSFAIDDQADAVALFVFLGVGALVSGAAVAARRAPEHAATQPSGEAENGLKARDTDRLHAVADALRTSEVLISVHKRPATPEHDTIGPRAPADVRAQSSIWIAPSEGTACDTCGQRIEARDIAYEIVAGGQDLCVDRTCYQRLIAAVEHGSLRLV
jgi:hypothetical protein